MSEYNVVQLDLRDPGCLKAALKEMEYEFEEHKIPQALQSTWSDARNGKANIVLRRKVNAKLRSSDLGFLKKADGTYEMIVNDMDHRLDLCKNLKQVYGKHVALKQLKRLGCKSIKTSVDKEGRLKIRAIH